MNLELRKDSRYAMVVATRRTSLFQIPVFSELVLRRTSTNSYLQKKEKGFPIPLVTAMPPGRMHYRHEIIRGWQARVR